MVDIATVFNKVQIGVETTPGTAVAATKILTGSMLTPGIKITTTPYRASGYKYASIVTKGKEWTEAGLTGPLTYTEVVYWLASVIGTPVITTPSGATDARLWTFNPVSSGPDTQKTYTLEYGSSVRGKRFPNGIATAWGFTANRDDIQMQGSVLGQRIEDPFTITALSSANEIPLLPVLPDQVCLYVADTQAGLAGATALTRGFQFEFNISDRNSPIWPLNRANNSYAGVVETAPGLTAVLTMESNADGMAILTNMRANTTKFVRFEAIGALIENGTPDQYLKFQVDFAGQVSEPGPYGDEDGVEAIAWSFQGVHDSTWGRAYQVQVVNELTAL